MTTIDSIEVCDNDFVLAVTLVVIGVDGIPRALVEMIEALLKGTWSA